MGYFLESMVVGIRFVKLIGMFVLLKILIVVESINVLKVVCEWLNV